MYAKVIPVPNALDVGEETVPITGSAFANVSVTAPDAEKKFMSPALEIDSEQVPKFRAVTTPAVNVQLAVPDVTDVETEPGPPPPVTDKIIPVRRSPVVVAADSGV